MHACRSHSSLMRHNAAPHVTLTGTTRMHNSLQAFMPLLSYVRIISKTAHQIEHGQPRVAQA
jgi:hypothetical protein